ncbi:MAG: histidine kinase [Saprospiraceae bacterium]|jgi:two-component system LytT family sensor kinase|nr:histidine kinase [Saprospiraceae bacterium]
MKFKIGTISIHLLFWLLYIVSEYFANLMHLRTGENLRFFRSMLLSLPILIISTYFIALYAVPRFLKTERWGLFILISIVVAIFVFYGRVKWLELLNYFQGYSGKVPVTKVLSNVIRDYAIIALAVCIYIIGDYRRERKANLELVKSKAEAEIKLLKGQLHPHFLFNSLNNLYSLALIKSDLTADSILKLTELLDYLVYRANMDKVPLSKEVQLLNNYIGLEQLRYEDHLRIETDIVVQNDALKVAPLLLLPFAENCFKHGGPDKDGLFWVDIQLYADDEKLVFQISNSKKNGQERNKHTGGLGLQNIRQRLSLLYPGRHELKIDNQPDAYKVRLEIKIRDEKN